MIRLFVRHSVADFAAWKQGYDNFTPEREGFGVKDHAVYQSATDPNDVTVWHDFETLESAHAFMGADRLKEVMAAAGVTTEPTAWFTKPV